MSKGAFVDCRRDRERSRESGPYPGKSELIIPADESD